MKIKIIFAFLIFFSLVGSVSAWTFNGTVRDVDGNLINNTIVNMTVWAMGANGPTLVGANTTTSNASGWFNLSVDENSNWMYKPVLTHFNATNNAIDYIGQSLPQFPYREMVNISDINFYLKPAGTINITAINRTGNRISFRYQVKDTKLGYPIASEFTNAVTEAIVYVPRDRNYSIMIYPDQAMPISFDWNNFTSTSSYNITDFLSTYNMTAHTVQKTFNSTDNLIRLTGYIQNSSGDDFADWNEFTVVPFLLEPGNMVFLGEDAGMPYNMSAWSGPTQTDIYNLTNGFYNITLPGPAESATYMLFATARNGTGLYGGYRNITLSYSDSSTQLNFTMYPLMATNWGSLNGNISLHDALTWNKLNISSAKQQFNLKNASGALIANLAAHIEVKLDYTNYGAREFTFMTDLPSSGNASFYLPLLNASVKEINIYSQSYSPKMVPTKTAAQILNNSNITMTTFNPGDIDGVDIMASVQIALYKSNSTCDVPNSHSSCIIADSATMDPDAEDNFNPLSSIIGGGKISFRMGLLASGIIVQYINVDMLASGPPDALFDDSATTSTTGNFDSAMRFGSNGPTIYDYVIISMPYTEGTSSTVGLNESMDANMSIPVLYDENWNIIWNSSTNGTNGTGLAGNYSHYSTYSSQWQTLMGQNNCTRNQSQFNSTTPCYFDTVNNRIWIRLPHFSGTKPSITGSVTSVGSGSTTSSGGGGSTTFWTKGTIIVNKEQFKAGYTREIVAKQRLKINITGETHYVGVINLTATSAIIEIASTPQNVTLNIGDEKKFDVTDDNYYDILIKLNSINNEKANLTIISIANEKVVIPQEESEQTQQGDETQESKKLTNKTTIYVIIAIILASAIVYLIYRSKKNKPLQN